MKYTVTIVFDTLSVVGSGYLDTGNPLTDCFSGFPVIIANKKFVEKLFFASEITYLQEKTAVSENEGRLKNRVRIIPFGTIKEQGILKAFKPDFVTIEKDHKLVCKTNEVYVAIGIRNFDSLDCDVLLNPKIFESKEM